MNIIENKVLKACEVGDLDTMQELIKELCADFLMYGTNPITEQMLISASINGHLDIIKFLLNSEDYSRYMNPQENINSTLKQLLKSPNEKTLPLISYLANYPNPNTSYCKSRN